MERLNLAAEETLEKLSSLDLDEVGISKYNQRYLDGIINNPRNSFTKRLHPIALAWERIDKPIDEITYVDYGGGHGAAAYLAKEAGFGDVVYNDIYDVSCEDVDAIGGAIGARPDHIVEGDLPDLISYVDSHDLNVDVLTSYDVIEHIYDINEYVDNLPGLTNNKLSVGMSTGVNPLNPYIRKNQMAKQREAEHRNYETREGCKERDTTAAFYNIRKEIIRDASNGLSDKEVDILAHRTRGMIESDIKDAVAEYEDNGRFPPEPRHPTNTCDPYTGNWAEHLMHPDYIRRAMETVGYEAEVRPDWWCGSTPLRRVAGEVLNGLGWAAEKFRPLHSVRFTSGYCVVGSIESDNF